MDLGDLNIVAIAPTPKVQPAKRKKNNKYERRRQKAEAAKRKNDPWAHRVKTTKSKHLSDKNGENSVDASATTSEENAPTASLSSLNPKLQTPNEKDESVVKKTISMETDTEKALDKVETRQEEGRGIETHVETAEDSSTPSPVAPSRRRRHKDDKSSSLTADLDHAKYMAEFHARPMELDRRSGARSSGGISKASTHLFVPEDWDSLRLHPRLVQSITDKPFQLKQPTSVQSRAITTMQDPQNEQRNILIHGETGSGKTLAYLLPILHRLGFPNGDGDNRNERPSRKDLGTKCIILCPTRELASQTLTVVEKLCQSNFAGWMVPGGLLGGDSRSSEKSRIRKGLAVIVATPGRLLDHLHKTESLLLNLKGKLQWIVLDEADRLLDLGLGDQVKQIVQLIRANEASKVQPWWRSVLVSATVTQSVQALAKERMLCGDQSWIWVKGGSDSANRKKEKDKDSANDKDKNSEENENQTGRGEEGYSESTPRQLAQFHITVTAKLRLSTLISFLVQRVAQGERTVVFMGTCASVDFHHQLFHSMESLWVKDNYDDQNEEDSSNGKCLFGTKGAVFKLHGSVAHSKRNQTLKLFDKSTRGAILLTTDVSARGLNLEDVDWIVQYDPPCEIADYVHRVGRVARAGKAGHSLLFLLPSEKGYLGVLQTKGISKTEPLSLAATLNKAASLCSDWTNAGLKHGGNKELSQRSNSGDSVRGSRLGEHFAGEVQRCLEDCIIQDNLTAKEKWKEEKKLNKKRRKNERTGKKEGELLELARDAFLSFLRAYPTKREPSVRSIFSARALHVGHIARSFALKDPPKLLVSKHKQSQKVQSEVEAAADEQANRPKSLQFNPFENNLVSMSDDEDDHRSDDEEEREDAEENFRRFSKRPKLQKSSDFSKTTNSKALLLQNAMKMQNNLMDAM